MALKTSIVGASGYSGLELVRILSRHRHVQLERLFANTSAGKRVDEVSPWLKGLSQATFEPYSAEAACNSDLIFIALPSREAMNIVPELLNRGKKVIDLGGDFRLKDPMLYEKYYKLPHSSPGLLENAVYGLPEWHRKEIRNAALVANPGCYPTSAVLPLAPLLKDGLVHHSGISISSLSGVSGAGRSSSAELSFVEVNESVRAYKVGHHQHLPEIKTSLGTIVGKDVALTFVPHLIPITRGIYTSIYAPLVDGTMEVDIVKSYEKYYATEPFVRYSSTAIPEIRNVQYTNFIDIGFRTDPENHQVVILSVIDNLVKGAAGQAVQNMNIMFGLNETEGLI